MGAGLDANRFRGGRTGESGAGSDWERDDFVLDMDGFRATGGFGGVGVDARCIPIEGTRSTCPEEVPAC